MPRNRRGVRYVGPPYRGRWQATRTGRFVTNRTVARNLRVPPRAIRGNEREVRRWVEVAAVTRARVGKGKTARWVESLTVRYVFQPTKRQERDAKAAARARANAAVRSRLSPAERKVARYVRGVEVRVTMARRRKTDRTEVRTAKKIPRDERERFDWQAHDMVGK